MIYAFEERIGDPSLFCGRKNEMTLLMNWINKIPRKLSKSKALLGRRKSGKTAIMQRLFNILWNQNGRIVPFYFEVRDQNRWLLHFADEYLRTFLTQYLSFLTRTPLPLNNEIYKWNVLEQKAREINNDNILERIDTFYECFEKENEDGAINVAVGSPYWFSGQDKYNFVIMIDEIQYMTQYIFQDKQHKVRIYNLPGIFHGMVELKFCPMLVSGSYIGWMTRMMSEMFVGGRLKINPVSSELTFEEGLTAVYKYSELNQINITEEIAIAINIMTQCNPYYISSFLGSEWIDRDFSSFSGIAKTFANEITDKNSELHRTWIEYIQSTLSTVNDKYAKKILLMLSKERNKEFTRKEILKEIGWSDDQDNVLEKKLRELVYGDLITEGSTAYHYKGISDNILYLIFYQKYQYEIYNEESNVYNKLYEKIEKLEKDKKSMQSRINELKGRMLELVVWRELNKNKNKNSTINNLKNKFRPIRINNKDLEDKICFLENAKFDMVWMNYFLNTPATMPLEMDVLAIGEDDDNIWALAFETKNRNEKNLPTIEEGKIFFNKLNILSDILKQDKNIVVYGIYFSANGFSENVETWLHNKGILTVDWDTWGKII
jgi:hypothetical protein